MIENWYFAHSSLNRASMRKTQLQLEKELNIKLINPFYDVEKKPTPVSIVKGDLRSIKNSKGVIAVIDDKITLGTYMEIFFNSYMLKRPTYVIILSPSLYFHPWLRYLATRRFRSFNSFKKFWRRHRR